MQLQEGDLMIKIAVCDDEVSAVQNLSDNIKSFMDSKDLKYTISKFFDSESLLLDISMKNIYFDAVFLDIKMNQMNGMDAAKEIRKANNKTNIIFVTALKEYVFDSFEVDAVNYLVKPIEIQKLQRTLEKLVRLVSSTDDNFIIIHKNSEITKISFSDIMYCEAVNHHIFLYERNNIHEYKSKIDDLEKELTDDFFRCHRSYIVNLKYVDSYSNGFAYLPSSERIPIAIRRQQAFMKALLHYQRREVR